MTFKYAKSGLSGKIFKLGTFNRRVFNFPLKEGYMPNVNNSDYFQAIYYFPKTKTGKSMILNGHIAPLPALTTADKNDLLYQLDKFNNRRNGGRFNSTLNNSDYINRGPAGKNYTRLIL